jgi:hypothetical protein
VLQPTNRVSLNRDHLCLPDDRDGHDAHADYTEQENKADPRFLNWTIEYLLNPNHRTGSPKSPFLLAYNMNEPKQNTAIFAAVKPYLHGN